MHFVCKALFLEPVLFHNLFVASTTSLAIDSNNFLDCFVNVFSFFAKNWDKERIANIDMILMKMAMTEARCFEQIPLKVTLNEYIEMSKYYSLPKSSGFINGVLDQAFEKLIKEKIIKKIGRGLIQ